jgi:cobalt-precorrin 5A hydrolase
MAGGEAMSAAVGIGCRAGASAEAIERLVREALARAGLAGADLYAPSRKAGPALAEAAARLGLELHYCDEAALPDVAAGVVSHSPRVAALYGVGSVAEAAALAGAGAGARIVVAKFSADGVSCAVARGEP